VLQVADAARLAEQFKAHNIGALICIGGLNTYLQAITLLQSARDTPELQIPLLCVPATIDNNLPATHFSIGSDTALNSIVEAVDKIKHAAVTTHRAFVVEVMGRNCGYLAQLSALASGAEQAYIPEEEISLAGLLDDLRTLSRGFHNGKRLAVLIRNEQASERYDTDFLQRVLEAEGDGDFEVRTAVLGHLQRGGAPSPFDRILGSRLGANAATEVIAQLRAGRTEAQAIGVRSRGVELTPLEAACKELDPVAGRPIDQWWLSLRDLARIMGQPAPGQTSTSG